MENNEINRENNIDINEKIMVEQKAEETPAKQCWLKKPISTCTLMTCNVVLFVGLVVIYILHFCGVGTPGKSNPNAKAPMDTEGRQLKVAYINTDSLNAKYDYVKDLEAELKAYSTQQENSLKSQMTTLQNDAAKLQSDYQNYLKTGDQLTLTQQHAKEAELKTREEQINKRLETLQTLQQELALKVQQRQLTENDKMVKAVYAFIREYNNDNQQFDLILAKSQISSPVLYGDEAMDITDEIIDGLNKEYKSIKKTRKSESKKQDKK